MHVGVFMCLSLSLCLPLSLIMPFGYTCLCVRNTNVSIHEDVYA